MSVVDTIISNLSEEELYIMKQRFYSWNKLQDLYRDNEDFRSYVDKYCKSYNLHKDIAMLHKLVQAVGEDYIRRDELKGKDTCPIPKYNYDLPDDKSC